MAQVFIIRNDGVVIEQFLNVRGDILGIVNTVAVDFPPYASDWAYYLQVQQYQGETTQFETYTGATLVCMVVKR